MKTWRWIALGLLTVASLIGQIMGEHGPGFWTLIPVFWAVFGYLGCVLIIIVSKAVGKYIVERRENYYDEP